MAAPWEKYAAKDSSESASGPWEKYKKQEPTRQPGFFEREFSPEALKRGAGLAARTITELATDIPTMLADIPVHAINAMGGNVPTFASSRDALLTPAYGRPETDVENTVNIVSRAAGGGGLVAGGAKLGTKVASDVGRRVAETLAARPALQTISGGTGGAASETARQQGAGPWGQFGAGLAGALAPALLAPRAPLPQSSFAARPNAQAGARATVEATPEVRATGGGSTFGSVGPDESAGLSIPQQRLAAEGQRLGMRLTPGQATGSKALQQMEARLGSQPMTSGPFNAVKANNAKVLQREWAAAIGERSDTLDDATLANARDRIGAVYESVADDATRSVEPRKFVEFFSGLQSDTRGLVKGLAEHPLVDDVVTLAKEGKASGKQLQGLASKLGKAANNQMTGATGDRELGLALFRVKDYVDDLLAQGLSGERAKAFGTARQQYRNLMLLTQRVGVVDPAKGTLNPRSLASILQSKDKNGYLYGRNQSAAYNATRFAQAFAPIVGDSGTATRMPLQGVTDLLARIPLSIATKAYTSRPGVSMALRAQAAARAAGSYPRSLVRPFAAQDLPTGGLLGEYAAQDGY